MLRFDHRLSRDIDLFLHDAQWLTMITPRLNDLAASLSRDYVEQANSVKLVLDEGDIDFIVAAPVTNAASSEEVVGAGIVFQLEPTAEILAKKLLYRAEHLKPRDVFDLVVAAHADPAAAAAAVEAARSKSAAILRRLDDLSRQSVADMTPDILPIAPDDPRIATMIGDARRLLNDIF